MDMEGYRLSSPHGMAEGSRAATQANRLTALERGGMATAYEVAELCALDHIPVVRDCCTLPVFPSPEFSSVGPSLAFEPGHRVAAFIIMDGVG